jgi:hypothetical protein
MIPNPRITPPVDGKYTAMQLTDRPDAIAVGVIPTGRDDFQLLGVLALDTDLGHFRVPLDREHVEALASNIAVLSRITPDDIPDVRRMMEAAADGESDE